MHRTIVAAITPQDAAAPALELAVRLARPLGAGVVLGGVVEGHRHGREHRGPGLDRLVGELGALTGDAPHDVPVAVDGVTASSAVRGFHELVERHGAELLVLPHGHRPALGRALRGDITADAVFTAPCGVAVAADRPAEGAPRRIGVAWDRSEEAGEALEWAVQLAERTAATVEIVHLLGDREVDEAHRARARAELELLRKAAMARTPAEVTVAWGDPARVLAQAGDRLDLLVLGSRRRSPLRRALLGSFSTTALHTARCAVVVLPRGVRAPLDTAAV
jgi:nucleotide-binding universal stress UspA family protein